MGFLILNKCNALKKDDRTIELNAAWIRWLRMQGHRLPTTLDVTGLDPGSKQNYNNIILKSVIPDFEYIQLFEKMIIGRLSYMGPGLNGWEWKGIAYLEL